MRISIWQEFSSNHSSQFTIVATFKTPEEAQQAADEIQQTLIRVAYGIPEGQQEFALGDSDPATVLLRYKYGFTTWTYFDWILDMQHAKRAVKVIDRAIFIADEPGYSGIYGNTPFLINIFEQRGADVKSDGESFGTDMDFWLRCDAPDETVAQQMVETAKRDSEYPNSEMFCIGNHYLYGKTIYRDGLVVTYGDFSLHEFQDFLNLFRYVKQQGCSNIRVQPTADLEPVVDNWISLDTLEISRTFWEISTDFVLYAAAGTFPTKEQAQTTADEIRSILKKIHEWIVSHPQEAQYVWEAPWERFLPIEEALRQKYNLDWTYSIVEWMLDRDDSRTLDLVAVLDQYVLLSNHCNTWIGVKPFQQLLEQKGATVQLFEDIPDNPFRKDNRVFDLTITAPDTEQAEQLYNLLSITDVKNLIPRPWLAFWRGLPVYDKELLFEQAQQGLKQEAAYYNYGQKLYAAWEFDRDRPQEERYELMKSLVANPVLPVQETEWKLAWEKAKDVKIRFQEIKRGKLFRKNTITIKGLQFYRACTLQGLPSLVAWLRSLGCEVKYTIRTDRIE